jgi:hypothetical protein
MCYNYVFSRFPRLLSNTLFAASNASFSNLPSRHELVSLVCGPEASNLRTLRALSSGWVQPLLCTIVKVGSSKVFSPVREWDQYGRSLNSSQYLVHNESYWWPSHGIMNNSSNQFANYPKAFNSCKTYLFLCHQKLRFLLILQTFLFLCLKSLRLFSFSFDVLNCNLPFAKDVFNGSSPWPSFFCLFRLPLILWYSHHLFGNHYGCSLFLLQHYHHLLVHYLIETILENVNVNLSITLKWFDRDDFFQRKLL